MDKSKAVVAVFAYKDDIIKAINEVKRLQCEYRVFAPFASHEIEEATDKEKSPVRMVTITGAVTGLICGFSLAILTSLDWPLRVSAKDIVSIPGFVVVGYECTILFGAIFTLFALLHFCRIPDVLRKIGYDPRFSEDKFGLVVSCGAKDTEKVQMMMKNWGAEEVVVKEGL